MPAEPKSAAETNIKGRAAEFLLLQRRQAYKNPKYQNPKDKMVNKLVFARMSTWTFKAGKREEGFMVLDSLLNSSTRHAQGFRGYMSLLPEDPNSAVVLTLWNDEESLQASEKGVFLDTTQKVQNFLEKQPTSRSFRIFSTELFMHLEKTGT